MAKGITKFLRGAAAGLALGVGASIFLSTKKGKKFKKEIDGIVADFYKYTAPRLKKIGKMSQQEYEDFMEKAAVEYVKAKNISADNIDKIVKSAKNSWDYFSEYLER